MESDDEKQEPAKVPPYPPLFWVECGMWELDLTNSPRVPNVDKQLTTLYAKWLQRHESQMQQEVHLDA